MCLICGNLFILFLFLTSQLNPIVDICFVCFSSGHFKHWNRTKLGFSMKHWYKVIIQSLKKKVNFCCWWLPWLEWLKWCNSVIFVSVHCLVKLITKISQCLTDQLKVKLGILVLLEDIGSWVSFFNLEYMNHDHSHGFNTFCHNLFVYNCIMGLGHL